MELTAKLYIQFVTTDHCLLISASPEWRQNLPSPCTWKQSI